MGNKALLQKRTGAIFAYTDQLARRDDMSVIDADEYSSLSSAKTQEAQDEAKRQEAAKNVQKSEDDLFALAEKQKVEAAKKVAPIKPKTNARKEVPATAPITPGTELPSLD